MTEDCSASSIKAVLADCAISCCPWVDHGYLGDVTAMYAVESVARYVRLHVSLSVRRSVFGCVSVCLLSVHVQIMHASPG